MENEKRIIKHALWCLRHVDAGRLEMELDLILKLFDKFPHYDWDKVIDAFCGEEDKEC